MMAGHQFVVEYRWNVVIVLCINLLKLSCAKSPPLAAGSLAVLCVCVCLSVCLAPRWLLTAVRQQRTKERATVWQSVRAVAL